MVPSLALRACVMVVPALALRACVACVPALALRACVGLAHFRCHSGKRGVLR